MTDTKKEWIAEAGHWYYKDGRPCYELPNKSKPGEMRSTTIRDARKLDLVPSVTTVTEMWPKPFLTAWAKEQAIMAALTLPKIAGEDDKTYIRRIVEDGKAQVREAADIGGKIHAAIEKYYSAQPVDGIWQDWVTKFCLVVETNFGAVNFSTEKSFASIRYGGKVDLHNSDYEGRGLILDIKTKDGDMERKLHYPEQAMQLAAYRKGLGLFNAACGNIFISRQKPIAKIHVWSESELVDALIDYDACYELFVRVKKYDPRKVLA